jgi:hypothetical protein
MNPKVVLEFTYPEDEDKLLFALKGQVMYKALASINMVMSAPASKAEMVSQVKTILNEIFAELGE